MDVVRLMLAATLVLRISASDSSLLVAASKCASDADCQLNGICETASGACKCDAGWEGDACGVLKLIPAPASAFFRQPHVYTWGGSILYDPSAKLWHMWHSEIAGNCTLNDWRTTSQVRRHATAPTAVGPWTPAEVVVAPEAHNPQVVRLTDGTLVLFDSYGGYKSNWQPCKPNAAAAAAEHGSVDWRATTPPPCTDAGPGNLTIHVLPATSSVSPGTAPAWQRRSVPIDYPCRSCNLTPSPVLLNGTLYVMLHCDLDATHHVCDLVMVKATESEATTGPYKRVNDRVWDSSEAPGHPEDPGMWVDRRGNWHTLLHNGAHGIHLWSGDGGRTFHAGNAEPYPFTVNVTTVASPSAPVTLRRRERPVMVLDGDGRPLVLVTSAEAAQGPTFTLTQMIDTS